MFELYSANNKMVDPVIIILAIIFVIIVLIIIVSFFYLNRNIAPVALITNFGLTIRTVNRLYLSLQIVNVPNSASTIDDRPIITINALADGQSPVTTEGWYLIRPSNNLTGNIVSFFNPTTSGYMNYKVDSNGNIVQNVIPMDLITVPPNPIEGNSGSFLHWFALEQNNIDNTTKFRSLFPGPIRCEEQYLIIGKPGVLIYNPGVLAATIGVPTNNNNVWIVG